VIWWVIGGLVVGSLLVLAVAVVLVLRRVGELKIVARRLQVRLREAQRLVPAVAAVQARAEQVQRKATMIQERAEPRRAGRVGRPDS
jgi:hypothetical protein